jgi:hypothetical protein
VTRIFPAADPGANTPRDDAGRRGILNRVPAAQEFPAGCVLIELHLTELQQLFNSLDPTPFRDRDLDPKAEQFIAEWAREVASDAPLGLTIHVDGAPPTPQQIEVTQNAVRQYFAARSATSRQQLRLLFGRGRISLVIGLVFLAGTVIGGDLIAGSVEERFAAVVRESFLIGGWVAMWRPLEVFLYDWWPIRAEARLFDRLSAMTVRVVSSRSA